MENLFEYFDEITESRKAAQKYAADHFEELHAREENAAEKIITTQGYDLGIACPSLIRHKVIGGNKRGRIIKQIPKDKSYNIISYNADKKPVAFRSGNKFGLADSAYLFFDFNGYTWAVEMWDKGTFGTLDTYRIEYENSKIKSFYSINRGFLIGEEYHYSNEGCPIECSFYYYAEHKRNTSKAVPAGYENSPMSEYKYEIYEDKIVGYHKEKDIFVFEREYKNAASRRVKEVYRQFEEGLDGILENTAFSAEIHGKGAYFQLSECGENGYWIYLALTPSYGGEGWEGEAEETTGGIFIETAKEQPWEKILDAAVKNINKYLKRGKYSEKLRQFAGIGVGFPDGDTEIINV